MYGGHRKSKAAPNGVGDDYRPEGPQPPVHEPPEKAGNTGRAHEHEIQGRDMHSRVKNGADNPPFEISHMKAQAALKESPPENLL